MPPLGVVPGERVSSLRERVRRYRQLGVGFLSRCCSTKRSAAPAASWMNFLKRRALATGRGSNLETGWFPLGRKRLQSIRPFKPWLIEQACWYDRFGCPNTTCVGLLGCLNEISAQHQQFLVNASTSPCRQCAVAQVTCIKFCSNRRWCVAFVAIIIASPSWLAIAPAVNAKAALVTEKACRCCSCSSRSVSKPIRPGVPTWHPTGRVCDHGGADRTSSAT